ncbi:MAG TPA: ATP-binding protein [Gemmatimonadales bacterium]|nr:ATP-binding protein [Gemmatimonadales bacterium]
MTFQRKLLLGFCLMALPALLVGTEAIRSNALERRALQALGESMARTRTYAELETAMFDQSEVIWRYLSGMDPTARNEFRATGEVVDYWHQRWKAELRPEEAELANGVFAIQRQIQAVGDSIFVLHESGRREAAFQLASTELKSRLLPALTLLNREIYRRARESSVRGAYARLEEILGVESRVLLALIALALGAGLLFSWLISRSLARPLKELTAAMAVVGSGRLDHPIRATSQDEIGDLARAFAGMTQQLQRTQAELVQTGKLASIGEMAAAVAHGMRNPLASLRASAQLARRKSESPGALEQLDAILEQVDRLDRRISHLLSFARPAPFRPLVERLPQLVEGVLLSFSELLKEHQIELAVSLPADLPEIRLDPMQLEQAVVEIVSNAIDAMPEGGRLSISARQGRADAGAGERVVVLEIRDTGRGIPPDALSQVCEPFFTTRPEGTGLGLAIAKRYVEQNGGTLEIESAVGTGTAIRLRFAALSAQPAGATA